MQFPRFKYHILNSSLKIAYVHLYKFARKAYLKHCIEDKLTVLCLFDKRCSYSSLEVHLKSISFKISLPPPQSSVFPGHFPKGKIITKTQCRFCNISLVGIASTRLELV